MPELWVQIIISIVAIIIVVVLFFALVLKRNPFARTAKNKGREYAKNKVLAPLAAFARSNRFAYIAPATIIRNGNTANLDGIVVGYFGILAVISLGYSGSVYGTPGDDNWVQVSENESRHPFENPINEASAAVRVIRDALFSEKIKKTPVEVVYVFSHPKVQLALPRTITPLKIKTFKKLLKKEKYMEDCGLDIDKTKEAIKAAVEAS